MRWFLILLLIAVVKSCIDEDEHITPFLNDEELGITEIKIMWEPPRFHYEHFKVYETRGKHRNKEVIPRIDFVVLKDEETFVERDWNVAMRIPHGELDEEIKNMFSLNQTF